MISDVEACILSATGANGLSEQEVLQSLWSGYGSILRYSLRGGGVQSVVVKHVAPPSAADHPRGWNTDRSHQRKLKSYRVEMVWYRDYAVRCGERCRVPKCYQFTAEGDEVLMVLEDLDAAGYSVRHSQVCEFRLKTCLSWLANFHACFLGCPPNGLWDRGTYWHLATRPDELKVLANDDPELYAAAARIDAQLNASPYQTLVHGDAKLANFCFSADGASVAAVDFQYVGGGCGMKDVAYFIGSCLQETDCERYEADLLDWYFAALAQALDKLDRNIDPDALEADWRGLYRVAWADFHRFLKGWSPGHWKIHDYSERVAREVVADLKGGVK